MIKDNKDAQLFLVLYVDERQTFEDAVAKYQEVWKLFMCSINGMDIVSNDNF